jgi:hypothetical protein
VKHDLCYWMSNKPRITDDFFYTKYNELPNLPIIKESQLQIYVRIIVSIFVSICIHSFHGCYTWFGAYPNHMQITFLYKQLVNVFKEKKKPQIGTSVRARVFNAGLLVRSQFASGRPCDRPTRSRFSLVPQQMLSWYPNSTLHCMLLMQPSQW